jgi:hypothetical protein
MLEQVSEMVSAMMMMRSRMTMTMTMTMIQEDEGMNDVLFSMEPLRQVMQHQRDAGKWWISVPELTRLKVMVVPSHWEAHRPLLMKP